MSNYQLAQCNVGTAIAPLDHPDLIEFVEALDHINKLADESPGFVWRLIDEDGQSSSYVDFEGKDDPLLLINYSIWSDLESLKKFMYETDHMDYLRRRREWFEHVKEPTSVAWWVPTGEIPTVDVAYAKVLELRENGPGPNAFTTAKAYPPPE